MAVFEAIKQSLDLKFNNAFSRILHHLGGLYSSLFKVSAIEVQIWGIIHTCYSQDLGFKALNSKLHLLASQPCVKSHRLCILERKQLLQLELVEQACISDHSSMLPQYVTEEIILSKEKSWKCFRKIRPKKLSLWPVVLLLLRGVLSACFKIGSKLFKSHLLQIVFE